MTPLHPFKLQIKGALSKETYPLDQEICAAQLHAGRHHNNHALGAVAGKCMDKFTAGKNH